MNMTSTGRAQIAAQLSNDHPLGAHGVLHNVQRVVAEITGFGRLQKLLDMPGVTDVLVNSPDHVWIDRGHGMEQTVVRFDDEAEVRTYAMRLAGAAGRRLDDASPFVDAQLAEGIRLHAILPPLSGANTSISLRVPHRAPLGIESLVESKTMSREVAELLGQMVSARCSMLISGGTGAGKTTLLTALLQMVDSTERIITVEDSPEIRVNDRHIVYLHGRAANIEGAGGITMDTLVRQTLRMRPDRIVVGEVRGAEIRDLFLALSSGHVGSFATVHAQSAAAVTARCVALGALAGMSSDAVRLHFATAFDVVLHMARVGAHRILTQIGTVGDDGNIHVALSTDADGSIQRSEFFDALLHRVEKAPSC